MENKNNHDRKRKEEHMNKITVENGIEYLNKKDFKKIYNENKSSLKERLIKMLSSNNSYAGMGLIIKSKNAISNDTIIVEKVNFAFWVGKIQSEFTSNLTKKNGDYSIKSWFFQDLDGNQYDTFGETI